MIIPLALQKVEKRKDMSMINEGKSNFNNNDPVLFI